MKRNALIILLLITLHTLAQVKSAVWAPLFDQSQISWYEFCGVGARHACNVDDPDDHPNYSVAQNAVLSIQNNIEQAVESAYEKGFRVIDVMFFAEDNDVLQPHFQADAVTRTYHSATRNTGQYWVDAVEAFNSNPAIPAADRIRLRIRFAATVASISSVFGRLTSRSATYDAQCPLGAVNEAIIEAAIEEPSGNPSVGLLDLANECNQMAINEYLEIVLTGVENRIANTVIEEVSIALDGGNESGIYPTNKALVSFSNARYPGAASPLRSRVEYFNKRADMLKMVYQNFASIVNSHGYQSGVFFQTWAGDSRLRGSFDLYVLLDGTGINVLHHTVTPVNQENQRKAIAFSASVAEKVPGVTSFDTELSWAHFNGLLGGGAYSPWDAANLSSMNAAYWFHQIVAGMEYGAKGATFANWTQHDILSPPNDASWNDLIGDAVLDDDHFFNPNPNNLGSLMHGQLNNANIAIYISTIGRVNCEENFYNSIVSSETCFNEPGNQTYLRWFDDLSLNSTTSKVDVITDGMILADSDIFDQYSEIYVPYEVSTIVNEDVFNLLLSDNNITKFKIQDSPNSSNTYGSEKWLNQVEQFREKVQDERILFIGEIMGKDDPSYAISTHEVTQGEFQKIMTNVPGGFEKNELPVSRVTLADAMLYCNALSKSKGLEIVYSFNGATNQENPCLPGTAPGGACAISIYDVVADKDANGYRLPTVEEWNYAYRAGSETEYYWGDVMDSKYAWHSGNSQGNLHAYASKYPNDFGLYDMSGNVDEWLYEPDDYLAYVSGACYHYPESFDRFKHDGYVNVYQNYVYSGTGFRVVRNYKRSIVPPIVSPLLLN